MDAKQICRRAGGVIKHQTCRDPHNMLLRLLLRTTTINPLKNVLYVVSISICRLADAVCVRNVKLSACVVYIVEPLPRILGVPRARPDGIPLKIVSVFVVSISICHSADAACRNLKLSACVVYIVVPRPSTLGGRMARPDGHAKHPWLPSFCSRHGQNSVLEHRLEAPHLQLSLPSLLLLLLLLLQLVTLHDLVLYLPLHDRVAQLWVHNVVRLVFEELKNAVVGALGAGFLVLKIFQPRVHSIIIRKCGVGPRLFIRTRTENKMVTHTVDFCSL